MSTLLYPRFIQNTFLHILLKYIIYKSTGIHISWREKKCGGTTRKASHLTKVYLALLSLLELLYYIIKCAPKQDWSHAHQHNIWRRQRLASYNCSHILDRKMSFYPKCFCSTIYKNTEGINKTTTLHCWLHSASGNPMEVH